MPLERRSRVVPLSSAPLSLGASCSNTGGALGGGGGGGGASGEFIMHMVYVFRLLIVIGLRPVPAVR